MKELNRVLGDINFGYKLSKAQIKVLKDQVMAENKELVDCFVKMKQIRAKALANMLTIEKKFLNKALEILKDNHNKK